MKAEIDILFCFLLSDFSPLLSKFLFHCFLAEAENLLNLGVDKQLIGNGADDAVGHFVVQAIGHQDAAVLLGEVVLMVPHSVGSKALFIDEVPALLNVGNFRDPVHLDAGEGADSVADDHASVHLQASYIGSDLERDIPRRHIIQVFGAREEPPNRL